LNAAGGSLIQAAPQNGAVESSPAITAGAAIAGTTNLSGVVVRKVLGVAFPCLIIQDGFAQYRLPLTPNASLQQIRPIAGGNGDTIFNPFDGNLYWTVANTDGTRSVWRGNVFGDQPISLGLNIVSGTILRAFVANDRLVCQTSSFQLLLVDLTTKNFRTIAGCTYDEWGVAGPIPGTSYFYHAGQWSPGGPAYVSKTDWTTGTTTQVGTVPNASSPSYDGNLDWIVSNYAPTAGLPSQKIVRMRPDGSSANYIAGSKSMVWNGLFSPDRQQISFLSAEATGPIDLLTCNTDGTNRQVINSLSGSFSQVAWLDRWQVDPHPGYTYNPANGHWYKAVSVPAGISWTNAEKAAEAEGGHLATITNQAENDFVFGLVNDAKYWVFQPAANNSPGPWLGGYTLTPGSSGWKWVTNEPWSFTIWSANNPSGGGETKLDYFSWGNSRSSQWNDASDEAQPIISYIIEIDGYHPKTP
jgi:hypothetical protein